MRHADDAPITLADLRRALDQKERELELLAQKKDELAERASALQTELDDLGETLQAMLAGSIAASPRAARTSRPPRGTKSEPSEAAGSKPRGPRRVRQGVAGEAGSLVTVIRSVLERVLGPMRVAEIADAVKRAGYQSSSDNLGIIVANRLAQMEDVERVDRGLYQLSRSSGSAPATPRTEPADSSASA